MTTNTKNRAKQRVSSTLLHWGGVLTVHDSADDKGYDGLNGIMTDGNQRINILLCQ